MKARAGNSSIGPLSPTTPLAVYIYIDMQNRLLSIFLSLALSCALLYTYTSPQLMVASSFARVLPARLHGGGDDNNNNNDDGCCCSSIVHVEQDRAGERPPPHTLTHIQCHPKGAQRSVDGDQTRRTKRYREWEGGIYIAVRIEGTTAATHRAGAVVIHAPAASSDDDDDGVQSRRSVRTYTRIDSGIATSQHGAGRGERQREYESQTGVRDRYKYIYISTEGNFEPGVGNSILYIIRVATVLSHPPTRGSFRGQCSYIQGFRVYCDADDGELCARALPLAMIARGSGSPGVGSIYGMRDVCQPPPHGVCVCVCLQSAGNRVLVVFPCFCLYICLATSRGALFFLALFSDEFFSGAISAITWYD